MPPFSFSLSLILIGIALSLAAGVGRQDSNLFELHCNVEANHVMYVLPYGVFLQGEAGRCRNVAHFDYQRCNLSDLES